MIEDFLEEIYNYSIVYDKLNTLIDRMYSDTAMQTYSMQILDETVPLLVEACKELVAKNDISGQVMYESLGKISMYHSGIQIADELSINVLPNLKRYIDSFSKIDVTDEDGIRILSSSTGLLTLIDTSSNMPIHSSLDPMKEAKKKAEVLYNPAIENYVFYGCGLGYLPYQLYMLSDKSIHISIFFSSKKNYEYAISYGVLDYIDSNRLSLFLPDNIDTFIDMISNKQTEYYISRCELNGLSESHADIFNALLARQYTLFNAKPYTNNNFPYNTRNVKKFISKYDKSNIKKKIAVIAGGPSVDNNIDYLRRNRGDISIICVGTIYKRLLSEEIIPDIVTIIDPFPTTVPQVIDTGITDTSLFVGMDTYWRVADTYPGDKYLLAMDDDIGNQKEYATKINEYVFRNCTTVTTMAYYIAEYLGAEEIFLVGADFAYPNGITHASGTNERASLNTESLISVMGVNGKPVYSNQKMIDYRLELEEAIEFSNIKTYNLSTVGAKIKGCYE